jgi:hypothetical protein
LTGIGNAAAFIADGKSVTPVLAARRGRTGRGPGPARPASESRLVWIYVALGTAAVVTLAVGPVPLQLPAILIVIVGGIWALSYGPRRNAAPGERAPWNGLLLASCLFVGAMILRLVVPGAAATPPGPMVLLPDTLVVPAYLIVGFAFAGMLRRRRAGDDDPARVDALVVGVAAAFMTWTFLIMPSMEQVDLTVLRVANSFFPIIDVVLLVLVAQLALAGGSRQPALWLLTLSSSTLFIGDVLFTLREDQLVDGSAHTTDTLFMVTFMLLGGSALHPSMRTLTEPQQVVVKNLGKVRLAVIALMVVVPVVVTTLLPAGSALSGGVRAGLCVLLILSVFGRVVRSNNSRARAEQATRRRATHDGLTDLPNRELLAETIGSWGDAAAGEQQEISLLFLDLDRY